MVQWYLYFGETSIWAWKHDGILICWILLNTDCLARFEPVAICFQLQNGPELGAFESKITVLDSDLPLPFNSSWLRDKIRHYVGVSINGGTPIAGWFTREDPIAKWMITGDTPISGNLHVVASAQHDFPVGHAAGHSFFFPRAARLRPPCRNSGRSGASRRFLPAAMRRAVNS